jgi:hypothetical protein
MKILYIITLFLLSLFIGHSKSCLKLGEHDYHGGVPVAGAIKKLKPCCKGLTGRQALPSIHEGECSVTAGGFGHTCIACGDKTCDPKYENKCNCPEDCKD